jgi:glycine oxidase
VTAGFDVIVIGGGAIGAACTHELARAGRSVAFLESDADEGQAWRAAAGMLAPEVEAREADDPMVALGVAGRERIGTLAERLRDSIGIDIGFWSDGVGHVAFDEADEVRLRAQVAHQRQQTLHVDWLDAEEARQRWPWLGPARGALWAPAGGGVDPQRLVEALRADAIRLGATHIRERAVGIEHHGERVAAVIGSQRHAAKHVVVAAGAWSGLLEGLPRPLAVAPVRGEMAALPAPAGLGRAIVYGKGAYLVGHGDEVTIGSTMEYAGYKSEVTAAGLARIFAGASQLCPALARLPVSRTWSGLRPVSADGLPILGPDPAVAGLWYAVGHGRNGILLSGITGVLIRQLIQGEAASVEDLAPYNPGRFWQW